MYKEEVYEYIRSLDGFEDYTIDQCQQDLDALVGWQNLIATQDAGKVATLEEFKNKKFRYQLTPYTVELERLTIRLESISGVGGSLQPNLFEKIYASLIQIEEMAYNQPPAKVHGWWEELNGYFEKLNQDATDYIARLQSAEVEELMNTLAFLTFKDSLIEYLRDFIRELQRHGYSIERALGDADESMMDEIIEKVIGHELTIPRLERELSKEEHKLRLKDEMFGRWESLQAWFLTRDGEDSESVRLLDITNETIRKMTRFAYRIAESQNKSINRRNEYLKLSEMFSDCKTIEEAHELSAVVFGAMNTRHLCGEYERASDSISQSIWEESPQIVELRPKIRNYSERQSINEIQYKSQKKQETLDEHLRLKELEKDIMEEFIVDGSIVFEDLPTVEPYVRNTLLEWVGRAMNAPDMRGRTDDGRSYRLRLIDIDRQITMRCTDGVFSMPPMIIEFLD